MRFQDSLRGRWPLAPQEGAGAGQEPIQHWGPRGDCRYASGLGHTPSRRRGSWPLLLQLHLHCPVLWSHPPPGTSSSCGQREPSGSLDRILGAGDPVAVPTTGGSAPRRRERGLCPKSQAGQGGVGAHRPSSLCDSNEASDRRPRPRPRQGVSSSRLAEQRGTAGQWWGPLVGARLPKWPEI